MSFATPPASAAWVHEDARVGFEVVYFESGADGLRMRGCTTAVEAGRTWIVGYVITVDASWATRSAVVTSRTDDGERSTRLTADGTGGWLVDGRPVPELDGCLDVDLESSAMTNAMPVHRMRLGVNTTASAPAAYVRALDLTVHRLDQTYTRTADDGARQCYDYTAPRFDFHCQLVYDESGLVLDYPGIARRIA